ncbi:Uncharacterised protein [Actinobacillus pleuropneumoniae]|nr:Uncharacterised protein [Actinobacillus pleuropneumoniae]
MSDLGKNFEFEDSYHPINLNFSLNSFDLYHINESNDRIIYVLWGAEQTGYILI